MILRLVDRRTATAAVPENLRGRSWDQVQRLAAGIGQAVWPVDLVLVSDAEIAALNRRYRHQEFATDVLSFSYLETAGTGGPALARGDGHAAADLWLEAPSGARGPDDPVGELVLAPAFIGERCAAEGWPLAEELPWLIVHGCLHLLGWDHDDEKESRAMRKLEESILAGEGLPHPLRQRS